jgi:multidrug efflux pump subunit AcrB
MAERIGQQLSKVAYLRDIQTGQSLDYPTVQVNVDRERAGLFGLVPQDVSRALVTATSSSRFVVPNYWADPKSGIAYQVQVEIPRAVVRAQDQVATLGSASELGQIPLKQTDEGSVLIRDVATIEAGTMPGQYDRYNMRRQITLTANFVGTDLGTVARDVSQAIQQAGAPPTGVQIDVRGQIPLMRELQAGLGIGLGLAVLAVGLLLTANFQSWRLALVSMASIPAVLAGVVLMLSLTHTTLNVQSFIGAIMAVGVAMANAILLVTFARERQRSGATATQAATGGATDRLRAILMTSLAMTAGMLPMALAWGEAGQQNAPLGRAVIGGLVAATLATLFLLPSIFAILQAQASQQSASLDWEDPESIYHQPTSQNDPSSLA